MRESWGAAKERMTLIFLSGSRCWIELEGLVQDEMEADARELRFGRAGEFAHLAEQRVNAAHFKADDFRQVRLLVLFQQEVHEGFDGDEGVLHLVGHAGGKGADAVQPVQPAHAGLPLDGRGNVV